jgi:hypothetical protein
LILSNANAVENVKGTSQADLITGNGLNNVIEGFDGNDEIYGHDGNDTIYGGAGNDRLFGNIGSCNCAVNDSDTIFGEYGDDEISGEGSADFLNGGFGVDSVIGGGQSGDIIVDRPTIELYPLLVIDDFYRVEGHVDDDDIVAGMIVYLNGDFSGHTATVDENGNFSVDIPIEPGMSGEVTATVTDAEGLVSESNSIEI